jgi:hypothetical protein
LFLYSGVRLSVAEPRSHNQPKSKPTTNLSDPLLALLAEDGAPIDGVEVGPWFRPREIAAYRKRFPQLPFYFHGGDLLNRVGFIPGAVRNIREYLHVAESPWLSLHITFFPIGLRALLVRTGLRSGGEIPITAAGISSAGSGIFRERRGYP